MTSRPPIWIISLERSTHRRSSVAEAFRAVGLEFEFINAVDGKALNAAQRRLYSRWRALFEMSRPLNEGEFGAALSHLDAWQRMVRDEVPVAAVFEDDVEPHPDLVSVLDSIDELPDDWQVVTLHSLFQSARPQALERPAIVGDRRVCRYLRTPFGAQGYLLSLAGARRVLEVALPIGLPPDDLLYRKRPGRLRVYGIEPSVLVHTTGDSEVLSRPKRMVEHRGLWAVVDETAVAVGKIRHKTLHWVDRRRAEQVPGASG